MLWSMAVDASAPLSEFRWDDLRLFLVAYRSRSLTQAAVQLGLNQSTTSRRLKAFEAALGARLFDRTPEGLLPTELALALLGPAEQVEAASFDIARLSMGEEHALAGDVRLALSEGLATFVLAPQIRVLRQRYPGIRLTMAVSNATADLSRREADLALRFFRPARGDLVARRVFSGEYAVFASKELAARLGRGRQPLRGLEFVGWEAGELEVPEHAWEAQAGLHCVVSASSFSTRIRLAQEGCGAIALTRSFGRTIAGLVELDTDPCPLRSEIWLVTHRNMQHVPRVRVVWDFLEEIAKQL
jgi:DNA-binding transcriptional LysR family regulator